MCRYKKVQELQVFSVFDGKPRQGLESRIGMIGGAGTNDNFGESTLDTLDMHVHAVLCLVDPYESISKDLWSKHVIRRVKPQWFEQYVSSVRTG